MFKNKETIKTIVITVLVTAQIAFIGGIMYNQSNTNSMNAQVKAQVTEQVQMLKTELQTSK